MAWHRAESSAAQVHWGCLLQRRPLHAALADAVGGWGCGQVRDVTSLGLQFGDIGFDGRKFGVGFGAADDAHYGGSLDHHQQQPQAGADHSAAAQLSSTPSASAPSSTLDAFTNATGEARRWALLQTPWLTGIQCKPPGESGRRCQADPGCVLSAGLSNYPQSLNSSYSSYTVQQQQQAPAASKPAPAPAAPARLQVLCHPLHAYSWREAESPCWLTGCLE